MFVFVIIPSQTSGKSQAPRGGRQIWSDVCLTSSGQEPWLQYSTASHKSTKYVWKNLKKTCLFCWLHTFCCTTHNWARLWFAKLTTTAVAATHSCFTTVCFGTTLTALTTKRAVALATIAEVRITLFAVVQMTVGLFCTQKQLKNNETSNDNIYTLQTEPGGAGGTGVGTGVGASVGSAISTYI